MNIAPLPGVGITSEIYLITSTLADKDKPLSDTFLSDNSSNSQELLLKGGEFVHGWLIGYLLCTRVLGL